MSDLLVVIAAKYLFLVIPAAAFIDWLRLPVRAKKYLLILGMIAGAIALALGRLIALFYFDPRPFVTGHFVPLIPHEPDNGFPSDHTLLGAAVAAGVTACNRRLGIALWIITALVAAARVGSGLHHPIDVAGSAALAAFSTGVVHAVLRRWWPAPADSEGSSRSVHKTAMESSSSPRQYPPRTSVGQWRRR